MQRTSDGAGQRVKEIVVDALQHDRAEREAFVSRACGDDSVLRAEVLGLLDLEAQADAVFVAPMATAMPEVPAAAGRTIGGYEIREVIGSGGMGTVYEAVQSHPHRLVALKILSKSAAAPHAMKRFRHEVEILGRLRHTNIAQIHDAGTYDVGEGAQPYFVMELVKGRPLIRHVEQRKLTTRRRLELFLKVCDAVQYAHHKGVIHRDLKPDNILVDDSGEPKILDFGIARSTDSDIQVTTLRTDIGMLIGTIPYMSPEQVSGDPSQLDTRSDVYSLGVVLYELLCGRLPHDLTKRSIPEAARVIRDEEPRPLSSIDRVFRGDLDTIAAKALEKEPGRRYQTAAGLAADVRRYLLDEPIAARPASTWYQLRKFARRNKPLVAAAAVATMALTAGTVVATWQAVRAQSAAAKAVDIKDFLSRTLGATDFIEAGRALNVAEVLDRAVEEIEATFGDDPIAEAEVRHIIGLSYFSMSLMEQARDQLRVAYELQALYLGATHPETLDTGHDLAEVLFQKKELDEAEALFREVIGSRTKVLGPDHPDTLWAVSRLGTTLWWQMKRAEAEKLSRQAVDGLSAAVGDSHELTIRAMNAFIHHVWLAGHREEAIQMARDNLKLAQVAFGDEHVVTLQAMRRLGTQLQLDGRWKEAEPLIRSAFETNRRLFGEEDHRTLFWMDFLGSELFKEGLIEEGADLMRRSVAGLRRVLGNNLTTAYAMERLAHIEHSLGNPDTAVSLRRESLEIVKKVHGENHPYTLEKYSQLARVLLYMGPETLDEAEHFARRAMAEPTSPRRLDQMRFLPSMYNTLALVFEKQGKRDEALATFEKGEAVAREVWVDDVWFWQVSVANYGRALTESRQFERAEDLLLSALDAFELPDGKHYDRARAQNVRRALADLYDAWGKPEKAAEYRPPLREMETEEPGASD